MAALGPILVIGYGNELRGDDGAGAMAAAAVAGWSLFGVEVLVRHQLVPELAEPISKSRASIFLDAAAASLAARAVAHRIYPTDNSELKAHFSDPRVLLALAKALYGQAPPAWLVRIPAERFELGAPLSLTAENGVREALLRVRELLSEID